VDGVDYNFLTPDTFEKRVEAGDFLEYATVHGNSYGTLKESVRSAMDAGKSVMMDIDVQGAEQVRETLKNLPVDDAMARGFVDIFIEPPSVEELRARLTGRGEDAADVIECRLKNAEHEMESAGLYKYTVINDDLDVAYSEIVDILEKEALS
jgi:guanylate kinase